MFKNYYTVARSCICSECLYKQAVRKLFARVLASHRGGPGLIPGRNMSVSGPLVEDGGDLSSVTFFILPGHFINAALNNIDQIEKTSRLKLYC
jgi:hypothetical protein